MATVLTTGRRNGRGVTLAAPAVVRVAVYARVSAADRTNSTFTSIDAQVAACRSYIDSRASCGWTAADTFVDNGFTGGNANRPALSRLLSDVQAGRVDLVLVHRIDRLSRSLRDLLGLLHVMEQYGVAFASVNESFDSSTPIGKATLQLVGVFAELERATISARTRDKIQAARRKGRWTGGCPPWGYDVVDSKLVVNEIEAHRVREAFKFYLACGSLLDTAAALNARGWTTKVTATRDGRSRGGKPWNKGNLHGVITSPLYVGRIIANGEAVAGEHGAIVTVEQWERVQEQLEANGGAHTRGERHRSEALLAGLAFCHCGAALTPTFVSRKVGGGARKRFSYYACSRRIKQGKAACSARYVPAHELESQVVKQIASMAGDERVIAAVVQSATEQLAERKRALTDELRALNRAIKDAERERDKLAVEGDGAVVTRLDVRLSEHRGRIEALQAERAALKATTVEPHQIAALLAGSFDAVWAAMISRERRKVVELLADSVVAPPLHV